MTEQVEMTVELYETPPNPECNVQADHHTQGNVKDIIIEPSVHVHWAAGRLVELQIEVQFHCRDVLEQLRV